VLEHYGAAIGSEGPYLDSVRARVRAGTSGLTETKYRAQEMMAAKQQVVTIGFLKRANK
jgi:hypothetical protein